MKLTTKILGLCLLTALACNESNETDTTCDTNDPTQELEWLAAAVKEMEESAGPQYWYVTKARLGLTTVFIYRNCCPNCDTITPVYDCNGNRLGEVGDEISTSILDNDELVWAPENSVCNFP